MDSSEIKTVRKIAERAVKLAQKRGQRLNRTFVSMDILSVHQGRFPLRLDDLLSADDFNFTHDVFGIQKHLDRKTGELRDCFVPRFAA